MIIHRLIWGLGNNNMPYLLMNRWFTNTDLLVDFSSSMAFYQYIDDVENESQCWIDSDIDQKEYDYFYVDHLLNYDDFDDVDSLSNEVDSLSDED